MWKWKGKKRAEEGGDGGAPAAKRPATESSSEDDVVFEIGRNRRVSVRNWQGKLWVDIREFYEKDGKTLPGKRGISLPLDQWEIMLEHMDSIDEAVNENA